MKSAPVPVDVRVITAGKFRRYANFRLVDYLTTPSVMFRNIADGFRVVAGTVQSLWVVARFRPDVVFAKGGFVCLPVGWAARVLRVPVVIHDSDTRPGLTNKFLAPFAKAIATGYPLDNYPYDPAKSTYTGVPIRAGFEPLDSEQQAELKQMLGFEAGTALVVSVGGGLGSAIMNSALIGAVDSLRAAGARAVLVAGKSHYQSAQSDLASVQGGNEVIDIVSFAEPDDVRRLLAAADVVVTRASATFLQELAGLQKAIVAVPARQLGDQQKNAELYRSAEAAVTLTDDDLEAGVLGNTLSELLADSNQRERMAQNIGSFAKPEAARTVAELIVSAATQKP